MTTKLKEISKWLEEDGIKHKYKKKSKMIVFATGDEDSTQLHFIEKKKDSTVLQWHMQVIDEEDTSSKKNYVNIKDNIYKDKILEYILYLNYSYKIGAWEYDYNDGDIRFYTAFPLDDAKISRKQFDRLFHVMTISGQEGAKAIAHITETGEFPEDKDRLNLSMLAELFEAFQEYQKTTDDVIDTDVVE